MKKYLIFFSLILTIPYYISPTYQDLDKKFFTHIFKNNSWGGEESKSGPGSSLKETSIIRIVLPTLLKQLQVKTLLDIPCGDFFWMKEIDLSFLDLYIGADIVEDAINENYQRYYNEKRIFKTLDIVTDSLPKTDLIFCRDCFQHLTNECIQKAINNIKQSGSTYLLTSNFSSIKQNKDISGKHLNALLRTECRNLELPPFNFPKPLYIIDEGFLNKSLALWRIDDLPTYFIS